MARRAILAGLLYRIAQVLRCQNCHMNNPIERCYRAPCDVRVFQQIFFRS